MEALRGIAAAVHLENMFMIRSTGFRLKDSDCTEEYSFQRQKSFYSAGGRYTWGPAASFSRSFKGGLKTLTGPRTRPDWKGAEVMKDSLEQNRQEARARACARGAKMKEIRICVGAGINVSL